MGELLINNTDVLSVYGVRMGVGFIDAIQQPPDCKSFVSNKSRLENGTRYVITKDSIKYGEREITLPFILIASSSTDAQNKKKAFENLLNGMINISIPSVSKDVYKLLVIGYSAFHRNNKGTLYSYKVKLREPNPTDRA